LAQNVVSECKHGECFLVELDDSNGLQDEDGYFPLFLCCSQPLDYFYLLVLGSAFLEHSVELIHQLAHLCREFRHLCRVFELVASYVIDERAPFLTL
jgi:hypothetical protein